MHSLNIGLHELSKDGGYIEVGHTHAGRYCIAREQDQRIVILGLGHLRHEVSSSSGGVVGDIIEVNNIDAVSCTTGDETFGINCSLQ